MSAISKVGRLNASGAYASTTVLERPQQEVRVYLRVSVLAFALLLTNTNNNMVGERDSNMELMRVICMFMIVLCHSSFCVAWDEVPLSSTMLRFGANVGVYGFVLVSGYYMINSTISVTKLLRLWITVFSYSAGVYFILAMYGAIHVNLLDAFRYCTPFTSGRYWFVSTYFMLMLVSPLLNRGIKGLNKKRV